MQRPDLSNVDTAVLAYIEYLEKKAGLRASDAARSARFDRGLHEEVSSTVSVEPLPEEQETTASIITVDRNGSAKRTYRHLYTRQHRGGMGVFGIDIDAPCYPVCLGGAEENQHLLVFTNRARAFRIPITAVPTTPLMARGSSIIERLPMENDEYMVGVLPEQAKGYVALASESGRIRCLRHHLFGEHMRPGTALYAYNEFGPLACVCWTPGDSDIFMVTQQGIGIRFSEKSLSPQGDNGIRLAKEDRVAAVAPVYDDSGVFIAGADGRGTIRMMSGFAANKSPGGSGKIAIKSSKVVGAATVEVNDDLFLISRLGKVIRFPADEVPPTEGVVQGVNCMGLRGDEVVAVLKNGPIY